MIDCLFVNPNSSKEVYQDLAKNISAIEPPVWSLLLAQSCRSKGFSVEIMDCEAERLSDEEACKRIKYLNPRLVCFVTYGPNPNSGTTQLIGTYRLAKYLREVYPEYLTISIGSHTQALPEEVLSQPFIDFISINEGVYTLYDLLRTDLKDHLELEKVRGLGWKHTDILRLNNNAQIVPQDRMDIDLPGYAWDLLPYKNKPLDLYRAHVWHAEYNDEYRTPFAALYTSTGCRFGCEFCMINILNRTSTNRNTVSSDSKVMRFWSPEFIIKEFDKLINQYNCTTIRISDEMFLLNKKYYLPLLELLKERGYGKVMRSWIYSRVDSVNERFLDLVRDAGIKWLAIGYEAANMKVRREITKGNFEDIDMRDITKQIRNHGLWIGANWIVGFENENYEQMEQTKQMAIELMTENMNVYACSLLPGSPLYMRAKQNGWELPETLDGYSFHSYNCLPARTKYLTAAQVLEFRDKMWHEYFESPQYLALVKETFGDKAVEFVKNMTNIRLKRRILGD